MRPAFYLYDLALVIASTDLATIMSIFQCFDTLTRLRWKIEYRSLTSTAQKTFLSCLCCHFVSASIRWTPSAILPVLDVRHNVSWYVRRLLWISAVDLWRIYDTKLILQNNSIKKYCKFLDLFGTESGSSFSGKSPEMNCFERKWCLQHSSFLYLSSGPYVTSLSWPLCLIRSRNACGDGICRQSGLLFRPLTEYLQKQWECWGHVFADLFLSSSGSGNKRFYFILF